MAVSRRCDCRSTRSTSTSCTGRTRQYHASQMEGMRRLLDDGLVINAGVSNFPAARWAAGRTTPRATGLSNQVQYSLLWRRAEREKGTVPYAQRNDRLILRGAPLTQPPRKGSARRPLQPRPHAVELGAVARSAVPPREHRPAQMPVIETAKRMAAAHNATPAQVSLAWLVAQPNVVAIRRELARPAATQRRGGRSGADTRRAARRTHAGQRRVQPAHTAGGHGSRWCEPGEIPASRTFASSVRTHGEHVRGSGHCGGLPLRQVSAPHQRLLGYRTVPTGRPPPHRAVALSPSVGAELQADAHGDHRRLGRAPTDSATGE